MKIKGCLFMLLLLLWLLGFSQMGGERIEVHLDTDVKVCVGETVTLICPDSIPNSKVLTYTWYECHGTDSTVIGSGRSITVRPRESTAYRVIVQYLDMDHNLIQEGDFDNFPDSPGGEYPYQGTLPFKTDYEWNRKSWSDALWDEGVFKFARNSHQYHPNFFSRTDHTSGRGKMMVVNGHPKRNAKVWQQTIHGIEVGEEYAFSVWGMNVCNGAMPKFQFSISKDDNYSVVGGLYETFPPGYEWTNLFKIWTAPAGWPEQAVITLIDQQTAASGNDFAVDDFVFAKVLRLNGKVTLDIVPWFEMGPLEDRDVCEGVEVKVNPVVYGDADTVRWYKDGVLLPQEKSLQLVLPPVSDRDAGRYTCQVASKKCGAGSGTFELVVRDSLVLRPLDDQGVCKNSTVVWRVEVEKGVPTSYWWTPQGNRWLNTRTESCLKWKVEEADQGVYRCWVTSRCGNGDVSGALAILPDLKVTKVSEGGRYCPGTPVTLVGETNRPDAELSWSWTDESGRQHISPGGMVDVKMGADDVRYTFRVRDSKCGDNDERKVNLEAKDTLSSLRMETYRGVCENTSVKVEPTAVAGQAMLDWAWSGPNGFTSTERVLFINPFTREKAGVYTVTVTDECGNTLSASIDLEVTEEFGQPEITPDVLRCAGNPVVLRVTGGAPGVTYRWTAPDGSIAAAASLSIPRVRLQDTGEYVCRMVSVCGNVRELKTRVSLYPSVVAETPRRIEVCEGERAVFHMATSSEAHYVWMRKGVQVGRRDADYVINAARLEDAGMYTCVVTSPCGEKTTMPCELIVHRTTAVVGKSDDFNVRPGARVEMFVRAEGADLLYQWKREGGGNIGLGGASLLILSVAESDAGVYVCKVTGRCGEAEAKVRLAVGDYNELEKDSKAVVCAGENRAYTATMRPMGCSVTDNMTYVWKDPEGREVGQTKVLDLKGVTLEDAGVYTCRISGACGTATLRLTVEVYETPEVSLSMPDTVCEGQQALLEVGLRGYVGDCVYEWQRNGANLGVTTETYGIAAAKTDDAGRYECRVKTYCGEASAEGRLTVLPGLQMIRKPDDLILCQGDEVELTVVAAGENVSYAWSGPTTKGWGPADGMTYRNGAVSAGVTGRYQCVVNSSCGADTLYATVDVESDFSLVSKTANMTVCGGDNVTLWARTNLDGASWKWTLPNGTVSSWEEITLNAVTRSDAGRYFFEITSPRGCSALSGTVDIGVYPEAGPLMVTPLTEVLCGGGEAHFVAHMDGTGVTYSWMGPSRFSSGTERMDVPDLTEKKTGTYVVVARDVCKVERRAEVSLSLNTELTRLEISADTVVCQGEDVRFAVTGGGTALTYEWLFNGTKVGEQSEIKVQNATIGDAGEYVCRVTGECGTIDLTVHLEVLPTLSYGVSTEVNQEVCVDETVEFGVWATGRDVEYRWKKDGRDVGEMLPTLRLEEVQQWEGGEYVCQISSVCGEGQAVFRLRVKPTTRITGRSPDKYVSMNNAVTLLVIATGDHNHYEWTNEGSVVGADSILQIDDVGSVIRETLYHVKAVGDCGADSVQMVVRVDDYIVVPLEGSNEDTICEGSSYTYVVDMVPEGCYGGEVASYHWRKVVEGVEVPVEQGTESLLFWKYDVTAADTGKYLCTVAYHGCPIDGYDETKVREVSFELRLKMLAVPRILSISPVDTTVAEGFNHRIAVEAVGDGISYTWSKNDTLLPTMNGPMVQFNPVEMGDAGMYRVKVQNQCSGMSATSRLKVVQQAVFITPIMNEVWVCSLSDTTLAVEAVGKNLIYRWYVSEKLLSSSSQPEYVLRNVTEETALMCVAEGRGGNDTCYFQVHPLALPQIEIDGTVSICRSEDSYLQDYRATASDGEDLLWHWQVTDGDFLSSDSRARVQVRWLGKAEASVSVRGVSQSTGCVGEVTQGIEYIPLPEVWLDLPPMVGYCVDSIPLNRAWPMGGAFITDRDTVTGIHLYVKDKAYGVAYRYVHPETKCVNTATDTMEIAEEPVIRLMRRSDTIGLCHTVHIPVAEHTEGSIVWSGSSSHLDTADLLNPLFSPDTTDAGHVYFEVSLTDEYDCKATDYTRIRVVMPPIVRAMRDTTVANCNANPVDLTLYAAYFTDFFDGIMWSPGDFVHTEENGVFKVVDIPFGKTGFRVEVRDRFGCTGVDSVEVTAAVGLDISGSEVCYGNPIKVEVPSHTDFRWSDGHGEADRTIIQVGIDTLWVADEYGCQAVAVYTVRPLPDVNLVDTFIYTGARLELPLDLDPEYGPYDVEWQDGSATTVYVADHEGEYWVRVTDNMGCETVDTVRLTEYGGIHAPNAFLPESSGENSRFYLKEVNFIERFEMYIYNRWGELLYKTNQIGFDGGWDGTFKGKKCDVGTYVWIAFNNGEKIARGTVTLIK